jgi:hypothetical protein
MIATPKHYQVGDFIDALDTQGDWCVAVVTRVNPITAFIDFAFYGWSSKYD